MISYLKPILYCMLLFGKNAAEKVSILARKPIDSLFGFVGFQSKEKENSLTFSKMALESARPLQKVLANMTFVDFADNPNLLRKPIEAFQRDLLKYLLQANSCEKQQYQDLKIALQNEKIEENVRRIFYLLPREVSSFLGRDIKDKTIRKFLGL